MASDNIRVFRFGDLTIDLGERTLSRAGQIVPMAPKVVETLCLLVENRGRLMTKSELMDRLWPDSFVEDRNLTQNIFTIRKTLGVTDTEREFIETVPRRGYRFVGEIEPVTVAQPTNKETTVEKPVQDATANVSIRYVTSVPNRRNSLTYFVASAVALLLIASAAIWKFGSPVFFGTSMATLPDSSRLQFERLTESGNAFYPAISNDNEYIAYVNNAAGKFTVRLRHRATGSETEVVKPKEFELRSPVFSRDGNYIFYGARDGGRETTVYQIPKFGGTPRKVVSNVNHNFSLSPDGEWLAFFRNDATINGNHLVICRTDGSDERIIRSMTDPIFFRVWGTYPAWAPDGKRIVVSITRNLAHRDAATHISYFAEIDVYSGAERQLTSPKWTIAATARWLSDGSGLIVRVQDKPNDHYQLWHLPYPVGEARALTNDTNNYTDFALAADSSFIVTSEQKSPHNLQIVTTGGDGNERQITNSTTIQRGAMGLEWLPNGKELVYLQWNGLSAANIWIIDIDTLATRQITFDEGTSNRFLTVTPDGKTVFFGSNRNGRWHIWRIGTDGADLRQATDGEGESFPQISPDGQWLAYLTPAEKPRTLWKKQVSGGDPIKVADNVAGRFHFSPDSTQIVALYYDPLEEERNPWKHVIMRIDDAKIDDTGVWSQDGVVRWKPDGSGFYYLSTGQTNTNVWFYSVKNRTKFPVTNFASQQIIDLAISPDGRYLALARGERTSNLLEIRGLRTSEK